MGVYEASDKKHMINIGKVAPGLIKVKYKSYNSSHDSAQCIVHCLLISLFDKYNRSVSVSMKLYMKTYNQNLNMST